jgi:hypothetical protein
MAGERKGTYKVTNWAKYNDALVARGSITLWLDETAIEQWEHANDEPKPGRPFVFSDVAIECLLMLREAFRLPLRQTEGFAKSLLTLMQRDLKVPDYSSLSKRAKKLEIKLRVGNRRGPIDIVVDSTGLKVFGEGEWKVRKYGPGKRRTWRKLHLSVNAATQEIEAVVLTTNGSDGYDSHQVPELLAETPGPIGAFYGDGGYDKWEVYESLAARGITAIIPPQHNAKIKQHGNASSPPLPRDEAIRAIRHVGRSAWKQEVGYHVRSLGETAMYRLKSIFGDELKNRSLPNQQIEARLRCKMLNRLTKVGMPTFQWV